MRTQESLLEIPFNDLSLELKELRPEIDQAIARVLDRGQFILGPECEAFEQAFARYLNVKHVIGVASGTEAIQIALMAADIGPGDEVICPALTAAPTALAILAVGARPVFADIDATTFTLNPERLEVYLSQKTRAILPVHLYGLAADMPAIMSFARAYDLLVISDAAQAHGTRIKNQTVGTLAPVTCFSFYPTKNLGAYGDAGAVVTNSPELAERSRQLRNLGQDRRFHHILPGLNSRLDELQAAILQVKLAHLDAQNAARRERAGWYHELLADVPDLTLPIEPGGYFHTYHLFVVRHPRRNALQHHLRQHGIGTDVHYPIPLHQQPIFAESRQAAVLPIAQRVVQEILSLPLYPQMKYEQVERVAEAIREFK